MATSTFGASPGVVMSWSEMWTWKAETPARVPAGARISAGKSGSVARSLPNSGADAGEAVAGELHAVAGVAGEADDDPVELVRGVGALCGVGHEDPLVPIGPVRCRTCDRAERLMPSTRVTVPLDHGHAHPP